MSANPLSSLDTITAHGSTGAAPHRPFAAPIVLQALVESAVIHPEEWQTLPREAFAILGAADSLNALLRHLVEINLLNGYQAARLATGTERGLVLGNYRVLNRIGAGGRGVVFEAEHIHMRRKVALKVLPVDAQQQPELVARFLREMRSVALLDHPNIVAATDAGICPAADENEPDLYYFVMEHLLGKDLEQYIAERPLAVADACALMYQAASALDAAHQHQLIHRDIKPSNIFITEDGNAKLLDFGLVRDLAGRSVTTAKDLVGTLDYMAPEQARDVTSIDIRADIFSLGATLFFALLGRSPFPLEGSVHEMLRRRQSQQPLRATPLRHDISEDLDAVLGRMMALDRADRYLTPQAVMHALLPFLEGDAAGAIPWLLADQRPGNRATAALRAPTTKRARLLVVDHDAQGRRELTRVLLDHEFDCLEAAGKEQALQMLRGDAVAAVLIGVDQPQTGGRELLRNLRENPPGPNLKIIVTSLGASADELAPFLSMGADDFLCLPLSDVQFAARIKAAVRHKEAQDHLDQLNQQLLELNVELECSLTARTSDLVQARNSLVLALARLVEYRSTETIAHLSRMQRYCTALAQEASAHAQLAGQIDQEFIQTLECVAPLHDIGNVGLPDSILLKAGPLDAQEHEIMQQHTVIGADTLQDVAHQFSVGAAFLRMAIDVARHHHEHYDGAGYPDGLKGDAIPLAARIVALADAYDSLRSRRAQRPRLSHASAMQIILDASPGKFDPALLSAFQACAAQLERIYREIPDSLAMD